MHFITNYSTYRDEFFTVVENVCKNGIDVVQFSWEGSDKEVLYKAQWVRDITTQYGVRMCVNNRLDIANIVQADYLHIGQNDLPIGIARAYLSKDIQIGYTITDSKQYSDLADYYGVGPIFQTTTKTTDNTPIGLDRLKEIVNGTDTPIVAIGGIDIINYGKILQAGCVDAAVVSPLYTNDQKKWLAEVNSIKDKHARQ